MNQDYSVYIQSQLTILQKLTHCNIASLVKYDNIDVSSVTVGVESDNTAPDFSSKDFISFIINLKEPIGLSQKEYSHLDAINAYTYTYVSPVYCRGMYWGAIVLLFRTASNLNNSDIESVSSINQSIQNFLSLYKGESQVIENCSEADLIVESMKGIPWSLDFKTAKFTYVGSQIEEMLGYKPDEWVGMDEWASSIYPEDREKSVWFCTNESIKGNDHVFEYRVVKKDGSIIWVRDVVKVIQDTNKNTIKLLGFIIDISDLKKKESDIQTLNDQLKLILKSTNTTLNIVDEDLNVIFHSGKEVSKINQKCHEFLCKLDKQCEECPILSGNKKSSIFFRNIKNKTFQVTAFLILTEGGKKNVASVWVDISDRVEKEKKIKELNAKLEFSMSTGRIAYVEYDFNTQYFTCNKYFSKLTGYHFNNTTVELEWLMSRVHSKNREELKNKLDEVTTGTRKKIDYEFRFLTIENKYLWLHFQGRTDKQDSMKLTGVITDITENKNLLIKLVEAKNKSNYANELKSKFLANMSHEIRTPMNAIIGFTNILSKHITQEPLNKYVSSIRSSGKVLLELINDLLDLEKINSGKMELKPENTNLDILINEIEQTFSLFARERNLNLQICKQSTIPASLFIDALKIKQVLLNLVNNALKFTVKGSISIDYSFFYMPNKNTGTLNITVSDTGIGISDEKQKIIFDPFIQEESAKSKDHKGTGLGLSIVQNLINVMGGSIILESKLNKGSKFIISIPDVKASESNIEEVIEPVKISDNKPLEVTTPINISQISSVDMQLLKTRFIDAIIPLWKELTELVSMKKMELFYIELQQLNEQVNWKELREYAAKLNVLIKSFDFEEIPNHLKIFDAFISAIETYKLPQNN